MKTTARCLYFIHNLGVWSCQILLVIGMICLLVSPFSNNPVLFEDYGKLILYFFIGMTIPTFILYRIFQKISDVHYDQQIDLYHMKGLIHDS